MSCHSVKDGCSNETPELCPDAKDADVTHAVRRIVVLSIDTEVFLLVM